MRSPLTRNLFALEAQNGRLSLFPGGIRHSTQPWNDQDSARVSMAFNVDVVEPGSRVGCMIPLTMRYCRSQESRQIAGKKVSML